ncbi:hypothetical protein FB389_0962 [Rarobacter incanus]|uniref:Uncharacterized protein n=1 Tax=Rarobacter incanus TaxID=153494 RepID=A0A542SNW3_9MICO|nr:hypothetical protein FB389_0962 [Rarobacter incanus]
MTWKVITSLPEFEETKGLRSFLGLFLKEGGHFAHYHHLLWDSWSRSVR